MDSSFPKNILPEKTKVLILAAGLGTRLGSLTKDLPKVMVPITSEKPLLEHTLLHLRNQGFREFIVNLHYLPEKIVDHFGDGRHLNININYSHETDRLLNTAGAIKKVESELSDNFLLLYGDMLSFLDFRPVLDFHLRNQALLTVILKPPQDLESVDLAEIDPATKKIVRWHHRPHFINESREGLYSNSAFYVASKDLLSYIPADTPVSLDLEVIPALVKKNLPVFGYESPDEILDIGSPERYAYAKEWYLKRSSF